MKKKVMKGLPKRIAAFVMAVLMFFSLLPIDPSVVLAAEGSFRVFEQVDGGQGEAIANATINVYDDETLVATGSTNAEGEASIGDTEEAGVLKLQGDYTAVAVGHTYEVISYGYKTATGTIESDAEIVVELEKLAIIAVSGTVDIPGDTTGIEKPYEFINNVELLDAEGNAVKVDDVAVTADVDDETGDYSFENVLSGYEYKLKISSSNNSYDELILDIDLKNVETDYSVTMESPLTQNETLTLEFPTKDEADNDVKYEVYIAGTQKTFAPSVKNLMDEDVTTGYEIEYSILTEDVQNVTVSADSDQNLVVQATNGATAGPIEVTATLTGADYVTVSTTVSIQIKEKIENGAFNFVANGITNGGSYEVDYAPNGTCSFKATADIKDVDGNVTNTPGITYAVIEDGEGEDDTILSIDVNTGAITVNKAGTATITATLPASGDYLQTTVKIKLTVKEIEQEHNLLFDEAQNNELEPNGGTLTKIFNANNTYNFAAKTEETGNVTITYSVTCNGVAASDDLVTIDGSNVTFLKAGTYVVTATASKENYIDETVSYTVNITKANPGLVFNKPDGYESNVTNGMYLVDTVNPYNFAEKTLGSANGAVINNEDVTYEVSYSENYNKATLGELIAVDANGNVTFVNIKDASVGTVKVTINATWSGDESYEGASIEYSFDVIDWNPGENFEWENIYDITAPNENGWYSQKSIDVTLKNSDKYELFATAPTKDTEGVTTYNYKDLNDSAENEISFYLMDKDTTFISAKYTITDIKVDTLASSISVNQGENTFLEKLLNFFKGQQDFEVKVGESVSENTIYYYVADGTTVVVKNDGETLGQAIERVVGVEENWQTYNEKIVIEADKQKVIYAKVVDKAGNVAYAHTNGLITDNTAPVINVTAPDLPLAQNGYYKEDFEITVHVVDQENLSGISNIVYWYSNKPEEIITLGTFEVNESTATIQWNYVGNIVIDADADAYNTKDGVTVFIKATDNAGNFVEKEVSYNICIEEPEIIVDYGENDPGYENEKDGIMYYDATRAAKITINSREDVFNIAGATVKVNGNSVLDEDWNGQPVEVSFTEDGMYTLEVSYKNTIGDEAVSYTETFYIDMDEPTGTATLLKNDDNEEDTIWTSLLETLTFGIWKKTTATVTATADPDTTDVTMQYYISNTDSIKKKDDLDALAAGEWTNYISGTELKLTAENIYAVYFKLTDEVGHVTYLSTDGFVVDMAGSTVAITPTTEPNAEGYYNSDVVLNISAVENISGIKSIEYWIKKGDVEAEHQTLYPLEGSSIVKDGLKEVFNTQITVDATEFNSDEVIVYAKVIDNAGYETTTEHSFKINSTAPTVDINYGGDKSTGNDGVNYFFNALRTATITITDRADTFDEEIAEAAIKVTLKEKGNNTPVANGIEFGEWKHTGDKHTVTVAFTKDGYYSVAVEYTNKAGLSNKANQSDENYVVTPAQGTEGALAFVIDREKPFNVKVTALDNIWIELLEAITFGLYTNDKVVVSIESEDAMSNMTYAYYIATNGEAMDENALALIPEETWESCDATFEITEEQQMAIFVRVTDQAGNKTYVNSNGIVLDKTAAGITLTPEAANTNGVYNSDVDVTIAVDDSNISSGIKYVEYWITKDGVETKREIVYTNTNTAPTKGEIKYTYNGTITVDAMTNNSSNVEVFVKVTDNAGNVDQISKKLDIDMVAPTIEVSYDDVAPVDIVEGKGFFNTNRTATIVVTERTNHFDKEAFASAVAITAKNSANASLSVAVPVVEYVSTTEGETADAARHTFKVVFSADANYTLAINYTDKAGWTCADTDVDYDENAVTPQNFAIDTTAPTGKITVGNLGFWESLLTNFTFGLWSPSDVNIEITGSDATSPIKSIEYYKTSTFTAMSETELDAITNWVSGNKAGTTFTVSSDDIFVVYAKITDQTGHVSYISSNGIIVDETKPVFETYKPEVTITPQRPVNGIYDGNVKVDIGVIDPVVGNNSAYAGLRSVVYEVTNMGTKTQEGTLYNFTETNPTKDKLLQKWNGNIVVDASKNNSNNVVVKVTATDNAGNQTVSTTTLKIDTTKPVIEVSYDNNNGDASFGDSVYYNANRVATIRVTERNFDPSAVNVVITNTDGTVPTISGWTTTAGTGNGDNTVHTATIVYAADGDYTFAISAKDKVGNANSGVSYGASQAPTAFTIDKTVPVISIAYDNNDFANENYYKADRTATITILEHNFDASRVVATITATDNGQPVNAPAISNWSKSGDTYTATVNYNTDALYTFDISYSDKAQNEAADFAQQSFYVDKTMPQMSITEIVDQSANNKDKIGFVITATDTNFDVFTPVLTAVVKTETGFATKELNIASINDIANGRVYTISNIDTDGIYRITCTLVDKAGNAYNSVTLHQADGTPYVTERTAADTLVSFSVNRDGSVFEVDEATKEVLDNYYVYDVKEDIVIIEVNANQLTSNTVSLNGKELVEGTDYTIATEGGNGAWLRYSYSLDKELFAEEGEYTIVVSSTDEAENNAFSDVKDMKVAFVVDRTAPVVTVSGLETNGKYQTDAQTVTLIPTDDGGAVKSIVVNQVDADGNVIKPLLAELSGEALETALEENDGQISFVIPSGSYDYIEIVCADCSVNEAGSTNTVEILIEDVLITENELALIWATYQYVIIGGGAAAVAAPTGIVLFRRRLKLKVK